MGNKKAKQLISLIILLLLTGFLVFRTTGSVEVNKLVSLQTVLGPVDGYRVSQTIPLDAAFISFLELDDYTQARYEKDGRFIDLYIGYFNSLDKISAAHSPLVCFPGQGWTVNRPSEQHIRVGQQQINYAEMTASLEDRQELVMYWYQADEKTVTKAYRNKINGVLNKLTGKKQEHAFVRVSIAMDQSGPDEARTLGRDFIKSFYPVFLTYMNSTL
ncbi:MAG: exosortase C-terminal domain/associated protein EpsI [Desulforhopalus sp.]